MEPDWNGLSLRLRGASGTDFALDEALAAAFGQMIAPFTSSVEAARGLVAAALPGWRLHLGFGATGLFPYASLAHDGTMIISDAPTVPLAILKSAVSAKACSKPSSPPPA